nr:MAG TPA: hypothetical protein [Caudoviricetes sp.]
MNRAGRIKELVQKLSYFHFNFLSACRLVYLAYGLIISRYRYIAIGKTYKDSVMFMSILHIVSVIFMC